MTCVLELDSITVEVSQITVFTPLHASHRIVLGANEKGYHYLGFKGSFYVCCVAVSLNVCMWVCACGCSTQKRASETLDLGLK